MSQNLHKLIRSLDKFEKSYFKKFAHKSNSVKTSIYYGLFDAIAKQKKYDESKLIKLFKDHFSEKQFSAAKNYLNNLILNCFCDYNSKKKILSKIHNEIEKVEFLSSKKLYNQALTLLEKTLKKTLEYELFPYAMQLLYLKETIIKRMDCIKTVIAYNKTGFKKEFEIIEQWKNFREYSVMMNTFFAVEFNQSLTKATDEAVKLDEMINSPFYQEESNGLSLLAKTTRFHILSYGANIIGASEDAYKAKRQNVELFQQNSNFCKMYPMRYISGVSNLAVAEIFRQNKKNTLQCIQYLEEIELESLDEEIYRTNIILSVWLLHYSVNQISSTVLEHIEELSLKFMSFVDYIAPNNRTELIFLLAYNYFLAKDYQRTIKWTEYFEQNGDKETSLEFQVGIKLIHLIANFEMGYQFYVEYGGASTYRFIRNRGQIYQTELALILFLQKIMNLPKGEAKKEYFQKFKIKIKKIQGDRDSCVYGLFDLLGWVEAKICSFT